MHTVIASILLAASAISLQAKAVSCGAPGSYKVVRTKDGQRMIFLVSREPGDVMFALTGNDLHQDTEAPHGNRIQFVMDGLHYSYYEAQKSEFLKPGDATLDDASILAKHAEWERQSLTSGHGPLSEFADLGNRGRAARDDSPAYTFKMWQMQEPDHPDRLRQVFLTTVAGDRVIVLSAIALNQADWTRVTTAMSMFYNSYALIPEKMGCPIK